MFCCLKYVSSMCTVSDVLKQRFMRLFPKGRFFFHDWMSQLILCLIVEGKILFMSHWVLVQFLLSQVNIITIISVILLSRLVSFKQYGSCVSICLKCLISMFEVSRRTHYWERSLLRICVLYLELYWFRAVFYVSHSVFFFPWFFVATFFCLIIEDKILFVSLRFTRFLLSQVCIITIICVIFVFFCCLTGCRLKLCFVCLTLPLVARFSMHTLCIRISEFWTNEFFFLFSWQHIEIIHVLYYFYGPKQKFTVALHSLCLITNLCEFFFDSSMC